jgi:C_GCAxxG_C_C family probable redox protein
VVVGHGGINHALIGCLVGADRGDELGFMNNTAYSVFHLGPDRQATIVSHNQTDHLEATETVRRAQALFSEGFSCSQSVIAAVAEQRGIDPALVLRLSSAFGGGMANSGQTCGAVSGALMAIGLDHGRVSAKDREAKGRCYEIGQEFLKRFAGAQGHTACRELIGFDLTDPKQYQQARREGVFKTKCAQFVVTAVRILEELLAERPGPFRTRGSGE